MANYYGMTRSNYFRVTDPERLEKIIKATCMSDDTLELWTRESENGPLYAFGGYGTIYGLKPSFENEVDDGTEDDEDPDFNLFETELQKIVASDDAIIITEIGYEKLRYLTAYSIIITAKDISDADLRDHSLRMARELLGNRDWITQTEY